MDCDKSVKPVGIGLYGVNGHQIQHLLENQPRACLVAIAGMPRSALLPSQQKNQTIREYATLSELISDIEVELISLCSPRRSEQAKDSMECLKAGKHVYAEKPCATTEKDLDRLMEIASCGPAQFREMGGTMFHQPYLAIRKIIQAGTIGEVIQVFGQKSYPYHDNRPQDEDVDGGLIRQAAIHTVRCIEHVACVRVSEVVAYDTGLGNPRSGGLKMAATLMMRLENGGVAAIVANYLNPAGVRCWANDHLRIFGTRGFVETVDEGTRTRLVVGDQDLGPISMAEPNLDYLEAYLKSLRGEGDMPLSLVEELHATRVVIRAKAAAEQIN